MSVPAKELAGERHEPGAPSPGLRHKIAARIAMTSWPAALIAAVLGVLFCFLPGLDAPNYHSALIIALPLSLTMGFAASSAASRALDRGATPSLAWRAGLSATLLPTLLPLVILQMNGVFVRQCDIFAGIGFFAIGPIFSGLFATFLGASLACWAPEPRRRRRAALMFLGVFLLWAAWDIAHIYRHPAIFVFNPFVGYLQGALYDTVVEIDSRIVLYRLNNLIQLGFLMALTAAMFSASRRRALWHENPRLRPMLLALLAFAVALGFFAGRGRIGYEVTRAEVISQLGGVLEDERLTLYYDRQIPRAEAQSLFSAHRFRIHQIEARLGATYPKRIKSFVYATPAQKRLLMGAAVVYIAKPWLDEIHLNRVAPSHPVIRHELAHVILGLFAPPPFRIPTRMCVFPHMAMVEGAAEAFEWDTGALSPHEWAHAMREAKKAPDLRHLLDPTGFLSQGSDKAYTLVGSFVRHLEDTHGIESLRDVYADADFERVYRRPVSELVADWERFIDSLEVPDDAAGLATGRFNAVAIQYRPCGLDVARVEQEAQKLASDTKTLAEARERYEQVVRWIPEDAQKRLPLLRLAARDGLAAVEAAYAAYLAAPNNHNVVSDAAAAELLADAQARAGDLDAARATLLAVAESPQPEDKRRATLVKLALSSDPELASALPYIVDGRRSALDDGLAKRPDDLLLGYLAARRLVQDDPSLGVVALDTILGRLELESLDGPHDADLHGMLRRETARLVAEAHWRRGDFASAERAYLRAAVLTRFSGDADRLRDLAAWSAYRLAGPSSSPLENSPAQRKN